MADLPRKRQKPRAADLETLTKLREQCTTWLAGDTIDGTPGYTSGPKRNPRVLDVADVELGTEPHPGEALELRWSDVDLDATPPRLTFSGTIIRIKEKGLIRQERTKTDSGYRTVILPPFVVDTLPRGQGRGDGQRSASGVPNRDGGIWDPHNFNRLWRQDAARSSPGSPRKHSARRSLRCSHRSTALVPQPNSWVTRAPPQPTGITSISRPRLQVHDHTGQAGELKA